MGAFVLFRCLLVIPPVIHIVGARHIAGAPTLFGRFIGDTPCVYALFLCCIMGALLVFYPYLVIRRYYILSEHGVIWEHLSAFVYFWCSLLFW